MTAALSVNGWTDEAESLPAIPTEVKDAEASKEILHALRHFHLGNPGVRKQFEPLADDLLPPLLNPYRDATRLRYDYPLFLYPADDETGNEAPVLAKPIARFLQDMANSFAPDEGSTQILKDNLPRLEWDLRNHLRNENAPVDARTTLTELASAMVERLHLNSESSEILRNDLDRLIDAAPKNGQFLAYGQYPAIHLLIHVIRSRIKPRQIQFQQQIQGYIRDLNKLLQVERDKSAEATQPESLENSVGFGADMFDPAALSKVMDHSHGSIGMSAERLQRVKDALSTLESYQGEEILGRFVHMGTLDTTHLAGIPGFEVTTAPEPCAHATELFDREAEQLAKVFAAARIARLEIESLYDPAIHDPWFDNFSWEAFSQDELLLVPAVIALDAADRVAGPSMQAFSQLLSSGRPVHILVRVLAHANPGTSTNSDPFSNYRSELGYFGISHRQAVVSQASAARPEKLLEHFSTALEATRTSLHLINVGLRPTGEDAGLNAWLIAGAALEGRVHPFFHINPSAGDSFADRMDFSGNPQPEKEWPVSPFSYLDENSSQVDTELAFTFADYALLINNLHEHFAPVPLVCESDSLLPIAEYLALSQEEAETSIPFVWGVNKAGELRQLAITRTLVQACRDRLNFWHTLQEMSGIRNRYVELAVEEASQQIKAEAAAEREQLNEEHEQALDTARAEVAGEVMGRLTDVLLGMEFTTGTAQMPTATSAPSQHAETAAEEMSEAEASAAEEEEEALGFDEAWIDSPLCTTCNDCTNMNPLMFVYNDNKQAVIADLNAGTYLQLVEAAEICPSKCIHPGKPFNPGEAGLEELVERAAAFN
ncbi:ferredoxin [Candidatus Vondammii sp. HM_W22]|uniref:ferredoxin n=1 Tax=Candidatus Vondammii sp. HM_W22 TaxID=2687299 RepID=UPI001F134BD4|nr:ferredoxin [Candidatus Vondammii sp. HM_W22]